jgi:hypothetical protein
VVKGQGANRTFGGFGGFTDKSKFHNLSYVSYLFGRVSSLSKPNTPIISIASLFEALLVSVLPAALLTEHRRFVDTISTAWIKSS